MLKHPPRENDGLDRQAGLFPAAEAGSAVSQRSRLENFASLASSRAGLLCALIVGCWPVLRWYAVRFSDGSDEPWGLAALASALLFAPRNGWAEPLKQSKLIQLCLLLAVYVATYRSMPALGRALLFVTLVSFVAPKQNHRLAWWLLLVLSLPVIATLQFYLGFPLRLATTFLCVPLLRLGGLQVAQQATALHWMGETVVVDAPCSGIHMLWTGLFLAGILACRNAIDPRGTRRLFQCASSVVFTANVLRAAALFCVEAKIWPAPAWAHEAIGLALFALASLAILALGPVTARHGGFDSQKLQPSGQPASL